MNFLKYYIIFAKEFMQPQKKKQKKRGIRRATHSYNISGLKIEVLAVTNRVDWFPYRAENNACFAFVLFVLKCN